MSAQMPVEGPRDWPLAPPDAAMPPTGTVRCWQIRSSEVPAGRMAALTALLSPEEQSRADRLRRAEDRRNFIAAHAGLRLLTAAALGRRAAEIQFAQADGGKPVLADRQLEFNLSHSGEMVLIAVASALPVGIDVERRRTVADRAAIAQRFLHPGEAADLASLPEREAELAFFRCWVRREAVAKALGFGLSLPPDRFCVSCRADEPARLLALSGSGPAPPDWSLIELMAGAHYVAALAVPSPRMAVKCRTLDLTAALAAGGASTRLSKLL